VEVGIASAEIGIEVVIKIKVTFSGKS
jgi:hypothetical protein